MLIRQQAARLSDYQDSEVGVKCICGILAVTCFVNAIIATNMYRRMLRIQSLPPKMILTNLQPS